MVLLVMLSNIEEEVPQMKGEGTQNTSLLSVEFTN